MAGLAVCGGSNLRGLSPSLPGAHYIQRHGVDGYVLPHAIDHVANMRSVASAGCDRVLALGSVGGLRPELAQGTFVCPDDFIAPGPVPTSLDDQRAHRIPGFDPQWRTTMLSGWREGADHQILDGGVYWQTTGPRLETVAEIRLIAAHAHVVGMTIASECTAAGELGLAYAAICVVDNLANGVEGRQLSIEELEAGRAANRTVLLQGLEAAVGELA